MHAEERVERNHAERETKRVRKMKGKNIKQTETLITQALLYYKIHTNTYITYTYTKHMHIAHVAICTHIYKYMYIHKHVHTIHTHTYVYL